MKMKSEHFEVLVCEKEDSAGVRNTCCADTGATGRRAPRIVETQTGDLEMQNCDELRVELALTFAKLKAGEIKPSEAAELANLAGKMIGSAKVQVEYYALRKEQPRIEWLESHNAGDKQ